MVINKFRGSDYKAGEGSEFITIPADGVFPRVHCRINPNHKAALSTEAKTCRSMALYLRAKMWFVAKAMERDGWLFPQDEADWETVAGAALVPWGRDTLNSRRFEMLKISWLRPWHGGH